MKPKPLHRSLTFWPGVLAIPFTLWAWMDSAVHTSYAAAGRLLAQSGGACVELQWGGSSPPGGMETGRYPLLEGTVVKPFPAPAFIRGKGHKAKDPPAYADDRFTARSLAIGVASKEPPGTWLLMIPHWLLLLGVAVGWICALVRRDRRTKEGNVIAEA